MQTPYEQHIAANRVPVAGSYVTQREYEVLQMFALGNRQADIARELSMSPKTVNTHVRNVRERLNAKTITHVVAMLLDDRTGGRRPIQ